MGASGEDSDTVDEGTSRLSSSSVVVVRLADDEELYFAASSRNLLAESGSTRTRLGVGRDDGSSLVDDGVDDFLEISDLLTSVFIQMRQLLENR